RALFTSGLAIPFFARSHYKTSSEISCIGNNIRGGLTIGPLNLLQMEGEFPGGLGGLNSWPLF
ncbi:MAG: hypothetical protein MI892_30410, partial [Desulfobacterales bacterium]|nr:hypothetical protein [Desulfobacterales bacterium]